MSYPYKKLFEPTQIGKLQLKNRFVMAAMGPMGYGDADGAFNQRGIDYYVERAKGGTGLIITGVSFVDNEIEEHELPSTPSATVNPRHFIRMGKEMTERIHAYDSKVLIQLSMGFGRVVPPHNPDAQSVSASDTMNRWVDVPCRPLEISEIKQIVRKSGEAAATAKQAGFDGVQIHAVHEGYLLDQFAIALFNRRTDEYGGSLENRLRFAKEVVEEIKRTCGEDFVVTLRFSPKSFIKELRVGGLPGEEFVEKGRDVEEGIEAAKLLVSYGYDALDVDVGSYDAWYWSHPPMYQEKGLYIKYAKMVKEVVDVPVICAGRMDDPELAMSALNDGACDLIGLGRPLLSDADYVNKLRANQVHLIRPCLSCHEGCLGRMIHFGWLNCAVNPQAGRERLTRLVPALKSKKVMIIGGGIAGCEAARVLKLRGHEPSIFEKGAKLGGNLLAAGVPDFKEDDRALAKWYEETLRDLSIPVYLNTEITASMATDSDFDTVIVATGSTPKVLDCGNNEHVYTAADVLLGKADPGEQVVVLGGGLVGCETALWLAQSGKKVTLVEALEGLLMLNGPLCPSNIEMLISLLPFHGVNVMTSTKAVCALDGKLVVETNGEQQELTTDSVILAVGYNAQNALYEELRYEVEELHLLGDARNVANIMYAIWDAFEVASSI